MESFRERYGHFASTEVADSGYGSEENYEFMELNGTAVDREMTKIKRRHIPALRKRLGIVFQDFQLLNDRTVRANLDFVLKATGWKKKKERNMRIHEVLEQVGMTAKADQMPYQLSGGEQQCAFYRKQKIFFLRKREARKAK